MDPADLRAGLAERLAGTEPIDAETFNAACFIVSRALGNEVRPLPDAGRSELARPDHDW